jgi:hypothetical protein
MGRLLIQGRMHQLLGRVREVLGETIVALDEDLATDMSAFNDLMYDMEDRNTKFRLDLPPYLASQEFSLLRF